MVTAVAKKVLVVEDDKDILQLVKLYLDNEGFRTVTAANGAEALKRVRSEHPDLVVLDLMLPEIDGLEVCKKLRVAPQTAKVPIIMLTAKSEESDTVVGFELGADDYVGKPSVLELWWPKSKRCFAGLNGPMTGKSVPIGTGSCN